MRLEGNQSLIKDQQTQKTQTEDTLKFISFVTAYKAYFFSDLTSQKERKSSENRYQNELKTIRTELTDPITYPFTVLKKMKVDFESLLSKQKDLNLKLNKKEKQLELGWEKILAVLEREILERLKNKKEFLPDFKRRLSEWSKGLPILNDLKTTLDVSYVENGKLEEVQSIVGLTQWILTQRLKGSLEKDEFFEKLDKSLLGAVEINEVKLLYGKVYQENNNLILLKTDAKRLEQDINSFKKLLNNELSQKIIPAWEKTISKRNNVEILERTKRHQNIVDTSTLLASIIILILFLYTRKIKKEEAKNLKLSDSIQKMRRINERGEFAAKMAHEIKNPLSILTFCLQDSLESLKANQINEAEIEIKKSIEAVNRLKDIANGLKSKTKPQDKRSIDLVFLLRELIPTYQSWLENEKINLQFETKLKSALVETNRLSILGAVSNLIDNAIEFLTEHPNANQIIEIELIEKEGQYLLNIKNEGPRPEDPEKIFHNFYSTKEGKDRGLGLSIVKDVVEEARGTVDYQYLQGKNTFSLNFPGQDA